MNVRRATVADIDAIHQLGKSVEEFSVNSETVNFWPKELLMQAVQSDDVLILVAQDEEVVGFLVVNYNKGLKKALIENIYIHPDKRGQGIGDKLLTTVRTLLIEMGCEYTATLVPPDAQGAIELYQRNGFSQGETFVWFDKVLDDEFSRES
jgi:ribosomal protein S18 acetylase RimI-like enzyme